MCEAIHGTPLHAVTGTVTITMVSMTGFAGNGEAAFPSGDRIAFSFAAPSCSALVLTHAGGTCT